LLILAKNALFFSRAKGDFGG
jgi:hypothetical protein